MQACTQFKPKLSLSTDRISNQSTTHSPGGCATLMNLEGKQKNLKEYSPHTFCCTFSISLFNNSREQKDKNLKDWHLCCRSSKTSMKIHNHAEGSYFNCFCAQHNLLANGKLMKMLNNTSSDNEFSVMATEDTQILNY